LQKQQNQIVVIAFVLLPKRRAYVIHNIKAQRESRTTTTAIRARKQSGTCCFCWDWNYL